MLFNPEEGAVDELLLEVEPDTPWNGSKEGGAGTAGIGTKLEVGTAGIGTRLEVGAAGIGTRLEVGTAGIGTKFLLELDTGTA